MKNLLGIERQIGDRTTLDLYRAVLDRAGAVIIAAANRNGHINHSQLPVLDRGLDEQSPIS